MRILGRVGTTVLLATLASCGGDARRAASHEGPAAPREARSADVPPPPTRAAATTSSAADAPSAPAPSATTAESAAPTAPASAAAPSAPPPTPLDVPGATACVAVESEQGWCARAGQGGECLDGRCITSAACPAYCVALAAREEDCMTPIDAECAKVPACVRDVRAIQETCKALRRRTSDDCRRHVCGRIGAMPRPPVRDSRE